METVPSVGVPQRSTFVTVVAWIFIVLAGFTTLMSLLQNIMFFTVMPFDAMAPAGAEGEGMPAFMAFMLRHVRLFFLAFLLVCAATLAAAIGLLRRKEWARLAFIAMLGLGIAWNLGGMALQYWVVAPAMMGPSEAPPEFRAEFERATSVILAFSAAMALGFTVLFGWLIAKLRSQPVRQEFRRAG